MKLLSILMMQIGTSEIGAVFQFIDDWQLETRIQFMCFDTMASNLAIKLDYALYLNISYGTHLSACRHHMRHRSTYL